MKTSYEQWIKNLNDELILHNQNLRVIEYGKQYLKLSNNLTLTGADFTTFKKRVLNKKTDLWVKNIDNLFNGTILVSDIKSQIASLGGKACQQIHGELIRHNLNVGTPWNKGIKGIPGHKQTQETKNKISVKNTGNKNGRFGYKMSEIEKHIQSQKIKNKILDGTFTPNSNNRNTHWDSYFNGKKYRSSWEALYQYIDPLAEYETLRIKYMFDNKEYVYIVDFINRINKTVVEVKPEELCKGDKFIAKITALTNWANINGYSTIIANKKWFTAYDIKIIFEQFDEKTANKIRKLYETNKENRDQ